MSRVIEMKTGTGIGIDFIEPDPDIAQNLFVSKRELHLTGHSLVLQKKNNRTNKQEEGNVIKQDMIIVVSISDELYGWLIPAKFWTM